MTHNVFTNYQTPAEIFLGKMSKEHRANWERGQIRFHVMGATCSIAPLPPSNCCSFQSSLASLLYSKSFRKIFFAVCELNGLVCSKEMLHLLNPTHSACLYICAYHININWTTSIKRDYLSYHCFHATFCYQGMGQVFMSVQFSKRVSSMHSIPSVSYFRIKMVPLTMTIGQQYVKTTAIYCCTQ